MSKMRPLSVKQRGTQPRESARASLVLSLLLVSSTLAAPSSAWAWQDLSPSWVLNQVVAMKSAGEPGVRERAWAIVASGRAAVDPLGQIVRKHPEHAWTAIHLLDQTRTDAEVLRIFARLLTEPPGGRKDTGEQRGFLSARFDEMAGRSFPSDQERLKWATRLGPFLTYDPLSFRFHVDEAAKRKGLARVATPAEPSRPVPLPVALAYDRLIKALHVGSLPAARALVGPGVKVVKDGGRVETRPELDVDAFVGSLAAERVLTHRDEGEGRWLLRSGRAYFHFDGDRCVRAGLKPIK